MTAAPLQIAFKRHPVFDGMLAAIQRADPKAHLLLFKDPSVYQAAIASRLERAGTDSPPARPARPPARPPALPPAHPPARQLYPFSAEAALLDLL